MALYCGQHLYGIGSEKSQSPCPIVNIIFQNKNSKMSFAFYIVSQKQVLRLTNYCEVAMNLIFLFFRFVNKRDLNLEFVPSLSKSDR